MPASHRDHLEWTPAKLIAWGQRIGVSTAAVVTATRATMLNENTLDQLRSLQLDGMVPAIEEQGTSTVAAELGFDDRLTLLVQREITWRDDKAV